MRSLVIGVLTGKTASWGSTQYGQYTRILGNFRHIGIEVEANVTTCTKWYRELKLPGDYAHPVGELVRTWAMGDVWTANSMCSGNAQIEVAYLFPTESPALFFQHTNQCVNQMANYGVTGVGGIHANFQCRDSIQYKKGGMHWLSEEQFRSKVRRELKKGCSFIQPHQLRIGLLIAACFITGRKKQAFLIASIADEYVESRPQYLTLSTFTRYAESLDW